MTAALLVRTCWKLLRSDSRQETYAAVVIGGAFILWMAYQASRESDSPGGSI